MNTSLLLPQRFKRIGWIILIGATIFGLFLLATHLDDAVSWEVPVFALFSDSFLETQQEFTWVKLNILPTLTAILFIVGALLVSFSREKSEDEYIARLRQSSWQWAVMLNYILLALALAFVHGLPFLYVMLYNMFTILLIFLVRFHFLLYRSQNSPGYEE